MPIVVAGFVSGECCLEFGLHIGTSALQSIDKDNRLDWDCNTAETHVVTCFGDTPVCHELRTTLYYSVARFAVWCRWCTVYVTHPLSSHLCTVSFSANVHIIVHANISCAIRRDSTATLTYTQVQLLVKGSAGAHDSISADAMAHNAHHLEF